jgi:hypothetical protein
MNLISYMILLNLLASLLITGLFFRQVIADRDEWWFGLWIFGKVVAVIVSFIGVVLGISLLQSAIGVILLGLSELCYTVGEFVK